MHNERLRDEDLCLSPLPCLPNLRPDGVVPGRLMLQIVSVSNVGAPQKLDDHEKAFLKSREAPLRRSPIPRSVRPASTARSR